MASELICNMQALSTAIASVLPAASRDVKDRPDICGVSLTADGTDIILTATDDHVTARCRIENPAQADADFRIMVPRDMAGRILAIIGNSSGECQIVRHEALFKATFEQVGSFQYIVQGTEVPFPLAATDAQWPAGLAVSDRELDLDPVLASRVKKCFAAAGADGALRFELYGPEAAIKVTHSDVPCLEALILPHSEDADEDRQPALFGSDEDGDGGSGETAEDRAAAIDEDEPRGADDEPAPFIQMADGATGDPEDPSGQPSVCAICKRAPATQPKHDDRPAMCDGCAADAVVAYGKPKKKRTPIRPNKARKPAKKKGGKKR
jgi:hypothetical protein